MRTRLLAPILLVVAASLTIPLIRGQDRQGSITSPPAPVVETPSRPARPLAPARDLSRLTKLQQQILLTAQRGADWLYRMHGVKGRFLPGYLPALKQVMDSDSYLRQAGAARALAQAARFCGEERYAARATQALLALLEDTAPDPDDSLSRHTVLPAVVVNRLGAAGSLVLAISELPSPQPDLLDRGDELCRYISRQARSNGSLRYQTNPGATQEDDGVNHHPGVALAGLMHSHRHRPAAWKLQTVQKALPYYRAWWKEHRSAEFVPAQTAAFAEAYLKTKDRVLADFVFEMNDWVCTLQYTQIDPRRMYWYGGFMKCQSGRPVESEPHAAGAALAEGLIEACRVAREAGDGDRFQRYSEAAERCLQFLATLQYTDAVTQHFAAWYRPQLLGAFHASHRDGNLRIDDTQQAVQALLGYLEHVAQ